MGKSPGRWIKNALFGKKTSKSNFAKGKEKSAIEKEVPVCVRAPDIGKDADALEVSSGPVSAVFADEHNLRSEYSEASLGKQDGEIPVSGDQNADAELTTELDMLTDTQIIAQVKAATKAQAAFRGYLARRAFKALKGIIRLQALIRGHLVRRQAVSTLYCIVGIVKLQALVRGSRIRCSDAGLEVQKVLIMKPLFQEGKIRVCEDGVSASFLSLSANAYIRKLLAPSAIVMPLRVQYEVTDPNSVQNWLQRWSVCCPWKPVSQPKKAITSRVHKKQGNSKSVEVDTGRPKRSVRKVPSLFDSIAGQSTSESEKSRRNVKKISSHAADSVRDAPQSELEKVKRSLRKIHSPVSESTCQQDVVEKPAQIQTKVVSSISHEASTPNEVNPVEKMKEAAGTVVREETITVSKPTEEEAMAEPIETDELVEFSNVDKTNVKSESSEKDVGDENTPVSNGELKSKEDFMYENQKSSRRLSSQTKQEHVEDGLQNTPKLPSYMQATESAKAKLRAQGSRFSPDVEENNLARRHSLPSSTNGKVSPVSSQIQKPLQGSGKSGGRSEKSLLSSGDASGKVVQAQWRR